ncbi:MAG TPA: FHA domain-containing protein [Clostridiales bacterium]|nr:FHA domain-containing protein [Clostridiales bacterium]
MIINYEKDLYNSYMVIENTYSKNINEYSIKMIQYEDVPGLLSLEQRTIDNILYLYYDISKKESINKINGRKMLIHEDVINILSGILNSIEMMSSYLLIENDLIIEEECIYIDSENNKIYLTYMPGYNKDIKLQLIGLIENIMNKIDYKDKAGVLLIYDIYAIVKDDFKLNSIKERLDIEKDFKADIKLTANTQNNPINSNYEDSSLIKKSNENKANDTGDNRIYKYTDSELEREDIKINKIPVMEERVTSEKEVELFPLTNYIYSALTAIIGSIIIMSVFKMGLVNNKFDNSLNKEKLLLVLTMVIIIAVVINVRIWSKSNRITKIIEVKDYNSYESKSGIDYRGISSKLDYQQLIEENDNATCLLVESLVVNDYKLQPFSEDYNQIYLEKFPFNIGKIYGQVDCYIDNKAISRYHAKIDKNNDRFYITDLNSTNGTKVNKKILEPYNKIEFKLGDELTFANISYKFVEG